MAHIVENNIIKDDADDLNIQSWLKSLGKGQNPKQAAKFTSLDVQRFLDEYKTEILTLPTRLLLFLGCSFDYRFQKHYNLEFKYVQVTEDGDLRVIVDFVQKHA